MKPAFMKWDMAKNKYFNACTNDIYDIGFNIEHENLGYRERIEFLDLLLKTKKYFDFSLQYVAKKTIGFNYQQLIDIIHQAELFAVQDRKKAIDSSQIDKVYNAIIKSCDIYKIEQQKLHVTSIHEMGHAMVAAHFNKNFILHNVSTIPQYEFYKSMRYGTDIEKSLYLGVTCATQECWASEKIRVDKEYIVICLAGRIAEQLFFGLTNGILLNHVNGFKDFIDNPGGAHLDLSNTRDTARNVIRDMKNQNYNTSKYDNIDNLIGELYEEALTLVRFYKNKIEQGAKILEQEEFMLGSQIYNLLKT